MGTIARVTRGEWRWPAVFAALVMAATTVPYLVAAWRQTPDWRFGGFLFGVEDGNSYIAKMGEGARGAWLFTLAYSSEPQRGTFMFSFYLALGKLAGRSHDAQVAVFHLARLICGWALLMSSYLFLAEFLPRVKQRRLGLALVALGGGLGWLLLLSGHDHLFGALPLDFMSPEAYTFLNLYGLPHLAAARSFFLLGLLAYLRGRGPWAGLALLAASLVQPLAVVVAWAVMIFDCGFLIVDGGLQAAIRKQKSTILWAGILSSPIVLYTITVFTLDPVLKQWNAQNLLPAPHPVHYLLGYGVYLAFGLGGWRALARRARVGHAHQPANRRRRLARFVSGWAIAIPFLLYAPIATQRRLIEGFQLPLVILAVWGVTVALRRWRYWLLPVLLSLTLPTSGALLFFGLMGSVRQFAPIYHPAGQLQMFDWLTQNARPGEVALSAYETGNALPAYTPLVAYIGHGPETVFLAEKKPRVAAFYKAETSDAVRRQLLADGRITWVIFGLDERALGDFRPQLAAYLRPAFANDGYAVYKVEP